MVLPEKLTHFCKKVKEMGDFGLARLKYAGAKPQKNLIH
jgi:hypothetical protein